MSGLHLVACPRPLTQAEQVALALAEANQLESYLTGFVWPSHWPDRFISSALKRLTGRTASGSIERRRVGSLPRHLVRSLAWVDVGRSCAAALRCSSLADYLWELDDIRFAKAARRFLSRCDTVHGVEHSSLELFQAARKEGKRTILHLASVHPTYQERVLSEQYERWPELRESSDYRLYQRRWRRDERRLHEFEVADLIATCSTFATSTMLEEGVAADRVVTVFLGAPPRPLVGPARDVAGERRELTVLFAGTVCVRKGGHVLLEAWERARLPGCRLLLAGHNSLPAQFARRPGVKMLGPVSQPKLFQLMQECDVLALPTLIDSFALVITEALAHGLPVITTANAGAAEMIADGVNGWILPVGDPDALAARLVWCAEQREAVRQMRPQTRQSARQNTWTEFRQRMRDTLAARGFYAEAALG
jgi:glycosyltransferase involved in cell wall biosynthesis